MNFFIKHVSAFTGVVCLAKTPGVIWFSKGLVVPIVFIWGLYATADKGYSQSTSSPHYLIESLGNHEGLNSSDISALYQDQEGFIWVGTKPGVSRFDSYDFQNFTQAVDQYIGQIHSIVEDHSGTLWVGGENGLFYYQAGQFHTALVGRQVIRALHLGKEKELWIGGIGFVPFFLNELELEQLKRGQQVLPKPIVSEKEWQAKITSLRVWAIDTDDEGNAWFGLDNQRVSFDGEQLHIHWADPAVRHEYSAIVAFNQDSVYWGSEVTGAILQQNGRFTKITDPATYIMDVTDSSVYFLTTLDLLKLRNGEFDTLHIFSTYSHLYFKKMILDREGNFWIGAEGNLLKLTPSYFQSWSVSNHPLLRSNHSIAQLPDGEIIIGSSKENILKADQTTFVPFTKLDAPYNSVTSAIFPDENGWIWYGTSMGGIILDKNGEQQNYSEKEGLGDKGQFLFYKDSQGQFWSGGERAITRIKVNENGTPGFENYRAVFEEGGFPIFQSIFESSNGAIWAASDKGLFTIKGRELARWAFPEPTTPYPIITGSAIDAKGQLWLSIQGEGLWQCRFDEDNEPVLMHQWSSNDGLLSNVILNVLVDKKDRIWAVSQSGICCLTSSPDGLSIKCYDQRDGWLNEPTSHYQLLESKDSMLWAVGATGVNVFPLYDLPVNKVSPKSFITEVQLFDGKEDIYLYADNEKENSLLPKNLVLPFDKNFLRFYFTTTSHTKATKNKFRYRLEGLDPDWNETNSSRNAPYPGLQAGTYTFKVQAANNDGVWGRDIAAFSFTVSSPWYKTWWAYTILLLFLFIAFYYWYQLRLRRRLEHQETLRLKELDLFKTRFYANITHEFRTPIMVILGMADELEKKPQHHPGKKLGLIKKNGRNLLALVNQILDLSKLKAGKLNADLQQSDVITFLKYLVEAHESFARLHKIGLQFYSEEQQLIMDFDPKQLELILTNLVSNAIKFTPEFGKVLIVAKQLTISRKPFLEIQVRDNGIGISAEDLPYIFDRFHQANPLHENEGSGIGLALVKELVGFMKGTVRVDSKPAIGTTFFLRFPVHNHAPLEVITEQKERMPSPVFQELTKKEVRVSDHTLPTLLIIEDNIDVTYYLKVCLEDQYQILNCTNGRAGVEKALAVLPDIIISDVMMPEMDGFEVCQILKADERTNHIPIVLLTAKATPEDKLTGLGQGADAYLIKPFEKAELLVRLTNLMEIRRTLQQKYSSSLLNSQKRLQDTPTDTFMSKVEGAIIADIQNEDFSVHELANAVNLSRSHVHRKIKALTGMSTAIYIRMVRIQKAKEILLETDLPVSEIAYQVGFKSPVYFSQVFKETFGESPSESRK